MHWRTDPSCEHAKPSGQSVVAAHACPQKPVPDGALPSGADASGRAPPRTMQSAPDEQSAFDVHAVQIAPLPPASGLTPPSADAGGEASPTGGTVVDGGGSGWT